MEQGLSEQDNGQGIGILWILIDDITGDSLKFLA
jgi:hypothetical protein